MTPTVEAKVSLNLSKEFQKIFDAYINCRPYNGKMVTDTDMDRLEDLVNSKAECWK